jgi:hypothetical protein
MTEPGKFSLNLVSVSNAESIAASDSNTCVPSLAANCFRDSLICSRGLPNTISDNIKSIWLPHCLLFSYTVSSPSNA